MTDYATWQQVARHLNLAGDAELEALELDIAAAMDAVHAYCGWRFDQTTATYDYPTDPCSPYDLDLGGLPLANLVGLVVKTDDGAGTFTTTVAAGDYLALPVNGIIAGTPWPRTTLRRLSGVWPASSNGRPPVRITGTFGWPSILPAVTKATIIAAAWSWSSKASPAGVATSEFGPLDIQRIPQAERLLAPYRRADRIAAIAIGSDRP